LHSRKELALITCNNVEQDKQILWDYGREKQGLSWYNTCPESCEEYGKHYILFKNKARIFLPYEAFG